MANLNKITLNKEQLKTLGSLMGWSIDILNDNWDIEISLVEKEGKVVEYQFTLPFIDKEIRNNDSTVKVTKKSIIIENAVGHCLWNINSFDVISDDNPTKRLARFLFNYIEKANEMKTNKDKVENETYLFCKEAPVRVLFEPKYQKQLNGILDKSIFKDTNDSINLPVFPRLTRNGLCRGYDIKVPFNKDGCYLISVTTNVVSIFNEKYLLVHEFIREPYSDNDIEVFCWFFDFINVLIEDHTAIGEKPMTTNNKKERVNETVKILTYFNKENIKTINKAVGGCLLNPNDGKLVTLEFLKETNGKYQHYCFSLETNYLTDKDSSIFLNFTVTEYGYQFISSDGSLIGTVEVTNEDAKEMNSSLELLTKFLTDVPNNQY